MFSVGKISNVEFRRRNPRDTSKTIWGQGLAIIRSPQFAALLHSWAADKPGRPDQRRREHARRGRRKRRR